MHLQFLIAVKEAIEFSLMAFGGFTLFVLAVFGLVKFWMYWLDSDQPTAVSSQPDGGSDWPDDKPPLPSTECVWWDNSAP